MPQRVHFVNNLRKAPAFLVTLTKIYPFHTPILYP